MAAPASPDLAGYGRGQRFLEGCSIAVFALLSAWCAWRLLAAAQSAFPAVMLLAVPVGWILSDLLSGLVHWALDSFGSVRTPVVGASLIRPFREHHADPEAMTRHDFIETHGASCFAALPLLVAGGLMAPESWHGIAGQAVLLCTALGALATNQCHKWAHMEEAATPPIVRWAQCHRLVLSRELHRRHHTPPFDTHFCTSSGWLNAPLDALLRRWR